MRTIDFNKIAVFFFVKPGNTKAKAGDFMHTKKLFILLGLLALIATTGGFIWFWWVDTPPRPPLRSRSVQVEYLIPAEGQLSGLYGMKNV